MVLRDSTRSNGWRASVVRNIVNRRLREAAKSLRERADITVHRTNKTAALVLINTSDLKSSAEFLDALRSVPTGGCIASLDVEFLFTNIPVDKTIEMIADRVYRDPQTRPLSIPKHTLRSLLELCTKKAPFINHHGHMYLQVDGVAMGSPLGVLFANFYMGMVEERVFAEITKPSMYVRYIDDTFICAGSSEEIDELRAAFHQHSSLHFIIEHSKDGHLPFLDVLVELKEDSFSTTVYTKPTNLGMFLNSDSECPERYKNSTITAYSRRALTHCSLWTDTHREIERASQVLVNNGHPNRSIQTAYRRTMEKWYNQEERRDTPEMVTLFYKGNYHSQYKEDERALKNIIRDNVAPTDSSKKIQLVTFYGSKMTCSLVMKNNPALPQDPMKRMNVIYRYTCPFRGCPGTYIGMTSMRLSKRISCHAQEGTIFNHWKTAHNQRIHCSDIVGHFEIIDSAPDLLCLHILEALHIGKEKPSLNVTQETYSRQESRGHPGKTRLSTYAPQGRPPEHPEDDLQDRPLHPPTTQRCPDVEDDFNRRSEDALPTPEGRRGAALHLGNDRLTRLPREIAPSPISSRLRSRRRQPIRNRPSNDVIAG
ncbi:uncharacterized protein [Macrobrachium rosenbergii]|uniref:uncharacterized protein n=1 Tax=Macrobrachium rosenbergii TaxID=79674 RepID=UPI0034D502EB